MSPQCVPTEFAPAERAGDDVLKRQFALLAQRPFLQHVADAMSEMVAILNAQRQIVFGNRSLCDALEVAHPSEVLGKRPGEALGCVHAFDKHTGCGTSGFCSACGAVQAILLGIEARSDLRECRILRRNDADALDLLVRTTPLEVAGENYVIVTLTDISHQKRRRALERVFFHDLMNTAAGVRLLADSLANNVPAPLREIADTLRHGVDQLLDEIASQRDLMSAENHDLAVRPASLSSRDFLHGVRDRYRHCEEISGCCIRVDPQAQAVAFRSDSAILSRVLGNMIKNAVEASRPGGSVTLGCRKDAQCLTFWVHNDGEIPRDVGLQLFQRSFSTKGDGRGLGTYSMKLLTERYLDGQVSFRSSGADGTTFHVTVPVEPG